MFWVDHADRDWHESLTFEEVSLSGDASLSFMAVMRARGAWPLMVLNWAWDANGDWNNASSSVRIFAFMGAKVQPLLR